MRTRTPIEFRLIDKIDFTQGECWVWIGAGHTNGYGTVHLDGRTQLAHRVVFELLQGPIPDDHELDHTCERRDCVNPAHLEAVTHRTNTLRGKTLPAVNAVKTSCVHGHPFTVENTIRRKHRGRVIRECRTCTNARKRVAA